jgi:hypothetical protein
VQVLPYFEPHKVLVDGPGIRNGIPASLETFFRIDTREAGLEQPEVLIKVNKKKKINFQSTKKKCNIFRILKVF